MKKKTKSNKGITLITLVITVIVIAILASVATYSGIEVINSSKLTRFTTEMKLIQTKVNEIYEDEEKKNELTNDGILSADENDFIAKKDILTNYGYSIDFYNYKVYTKEMLKNNLGIDDIQQEEVLIDFNNRKVVSANGITVDGETYYVLEQLPNSLYNVQYENKNLGKIPTFSVSSKEIGENKWEISINNIQYDGDIEKWELKYQLEGQEYWNSSKNTNFIVNQKGDYKIKLINNNIESLEKSVYIGNDYIKEGLVLYFDGIDNAGEGDNKHDKTATIWKDLSGSGNDGELKGNTYWTGENSLYFDGKSGYVKVNKFIEPNFSLEAVVQNNYVRMEEHDYVSTFQNGGFGFLNVKQRNKFSIYANGYKGIEADNITEKGKKYILQGTFSGNELIFYENGNKKSIEITDKYITTNEIFLLGADPAGGIANGCYLDGQIYSIRLYNRALTDKEINKNYKIYKTRFDIEE